MLSNQRVTIQWGGSDKESDLGVFICPIRWGAIWSYQEFPNHIPFLAIFSGYLLKFRPYISLKHLVVLSTWIFKMAQSVRLSHHFFFNVPGYQRVYCRYLQTSSIPESWPWVATGHRRPDGFMGMGQHVSLMRPQILGDVHTVALPPFKPWKSLSVSINHIVYDMYKPYRNDVGPQTFSASVLRTLRPTSHAAIWNSLVWSKRRRSEPWPVSYPLIMSK